MGALVPVAQTVGLITQGVGLVQNLVESETSSRQQSNQQAIALRQLQERQQLNQQQLAQDNALERERIAAQAAIDSEERRAALKRAVARQRAQFGSSGVSQSGGSSQAVLLGLFDETEDELRNRETLDNLRNRALDLNTEQANSVNILQREQLLQSQRVSRASQSVGRINTGIDFVTGLSSIGSGSRSFF